MRLESEPLLITGNGVLRRVERVSDNVTSGVLRVEFQTAEERAAVHALTRKYPETEPITIARSAVGQMHFNVVRTKGKPFHLDGFLDVPVDVVAVSPLARKHYAKGMAQRLLEGDAEVARLVFVASQGALSADRVAEAKAKKEVIVSDAATVDKEGVLWLPVEDVEYDFYRDALCAEAVHDVIANGRSALKQVLRPRRLIRTELAPGGVFVGAVQFFSAKYHGLISVQARPRGLEHETPLLLDANRNDGHRQSAVDKQVELVNAGKHPVSLLGARVGLRLYQA